MAKEEVKKKSKRSTAAKRIIQGEKRRLINKAFKSRIRTAMRSFDESLSQGDTALIKENLSSLYSLMDKGVKRNIFKINKASRTKARLSARVAKATS